MKKRTTTIEGILMASCDTPAANVTGYIGTEEGFASEPLNLQFTTDANGYFKVSHTHRGYLEKFHVFAQGKTVLKIWNLPGAVKDLGKIYLNIPTVCYYLALDVQNTSYTELDTLTYYDWGYPQNGASHWVKKVAGPFQNGIMDTVISAPNINAFPVSFGNNSATRLNLTYGVNVWDAHTIHIPTPHCVDEYQTVTLVID
jgi:hypothetical protein